MALTLAGADSGLRTTADGGVDRAITCRLLDAAGALIADRRAAGGEEFDRSIDVHVSRLRAKLGDDARHPRLLKTVRGVGYLLAMGDEP